MARRPKGALLLALASVAVLLLLLPDVARAEGKKLNPKVRRTNNRPVGRRADNFHGQRGFVWPSAADGLFRPAASGSANASEAATSAALGGAVQRVWVARVSCVALASDDADLLADALEKHTDSVACAVYALRYSAPPPDRASLRSTRAARRARVLLQFGCTQATRRSALLDALASVLPAACLADDSDDEDGGATRGPATARHGHRRAPVSVEPERLVRVKREQVVQALPPWHLDRIDQTAGFPLSTTYSTGLLAQDGANVTVYVIDTGVSVDHPDFGDRADGVYDYLGGNGLDCDGHGTHVAGLALGSVTGVAKQARLVTMRVLDCSGSGLVSGVIDALEDVAALQALEAHSAVVVMSLTANAYPPLDDAVNELVTVSKVPVAAAAGNDADNACFYSPARAASAICVAATRRPTLAEQNAGYDYMSDFSNYGSCVDVAAPGELISSCDYDEDGYVTMSGTSMATPVVAGILALGYEHLGLTGRGANANPNRATLVRQLLLASALPDRARKPTNVAGTKTGLATILFGSTPAPPPPPTPGAPVPTASPPVPTAATPTAATPTVLIPAPSPDEMVEEPSPSAPVATPSQPSEAWQPDSGSALFAVGLLAVVFVL